MSETAADLKPSTIRLCTPDDVEWMISIANGRYPGEFDPEQARAWVPARLKEPTMLFIRGERSFGVAHLAKRFNSPTRVQAYLTLLYSEPGFMRSLSLEPFQLIKRMIEWGKEKGATKFWMSDISGVDLGPFAKRLGGRLAGHTYVVDLDGEGNRYG